MLELLKIFWIFLKIGAFTFGGGYAMIPMIRSELVHYGLMNFHEVADVVAISQMTPGPFAVNAATFAGVKTVGVIGGIVATIAVSLPSFIFAVVAARFFIRFQNNRFLTNTLEVLRPAVTGLIAASAVVMIAPVVFSTESFIIGDITKLFANMDFVALGIAVASGIAVIGFKAPPIPVILIAGAVGIIVYAVL